MVGKTLSRLLKYGPLAFLGKPLFTTLIAVELWFLRRIAARKPSPESATVDVQLTALIKTFERPYALARLLQSIRRFYPQMQIIVVDDSRHPGAPEGVELVTLPYDSGVSAGRQAGLDRVTTPYVLLLDDDFIFYHKTHLEPALQRMAHHPEVDIMGGEVVNLPSFKSADYRRAALHPTPLASLRPPGSLVGGLPVYDKVPNFFIARTQRLRQVGWDPRIKRIDHAEFFTRAKGVLLTVYNSGFKVLHAQTPFDRAYLQKRHDVARDRAIIFEKHYRGANSPH